ncbi:MAG: universal stress protein [Anaerolineae bacterium]|nr:universal stress protein [Gloeobacterales cyanobacterium ES-bin-313]
MFQRILVGVDSSMTSGQVFESALVIAKENKAIMMIEHVLSGEDEGSPILPPVATGYYFPVVSSDSYSYYRNQWDAYEKKGLALLETFVNKAKAVGVEAESKQSLGSPGRQICETTRLWNADLVVTGRRGHTGLSELFLGSVSNYILHHVPCSVLIVQSQSKEETVEKEVSELAHAT